MEQLLFATLILLVAGLTQNRSETHQDSPICRDFLSGVSLRYLVLKVTLMNVLRLSLLFVSLLTIVGCSALGLDSIAGSGKITKVSRDPTSFNKVEIVGAAQVSIQASNDQSTCEIECDDNLVEFLETQVKDGTLIIRPTRPIAPSKTIVIALTTAALDEVSVVGGSDVRVNELKQESIKTSITGSGNITLQGTSTQITASIVGSGSVNTLQCPAQTASVSITGSGDISVDAAEKLSISISGSGDVTYRGKPIVEKSILGSGSVSPLSE